jgi:hypothetical protein
MLRKEQNEVLTRVACADRRTSDTKNGKLGSGMGRVPALNHFVRHQPLGQRLAQTHTVQKS